MSFKEFDLTDYINALEDFQQNSTDAIVKYWGNVENFDLLIRKVKEDEPKLAKLAIKEFGSVEKYTEAMKYNLEHFSAIMELQKCGLNKYKSGNCCYFPLYLGGLKGRNET